MGCAALLPLVASCSSAPQSSPKAPASIIATQPSPQSTASPAVPQSIPSQSTSIETPSEPNASPTQASRRVEKCTVRMARVNDPESPLNVRSSPNAASKENIVGQLKNGTYVDIEDEQNGWYKITGETPGWIAKSKTDRSCTEKIERVEFGKGQTSFKIVDRFIGVGTHTYRVNLVQGQSLTVTRDREVFPRIVGPSGQDLASFDENRTTWTGEIPTTGDYSIVFESNYKGYDYAVSVEAR